MSALVIRGDARHLPLADCSVDAVCADPPAGISFMSKHWDNPWEYGIGAEKSINPGGRHRVGIASSRNPMCRACGQHRRGLSPARQRGRGDEACHCDRPDFDDAERNIGARTAFIAAMTAAFAEALRCAKPGAHGLFWALPRTSHWTATALEDAGWEIRDCIMHMFGSGFPKSLDISKQFDKMAGVEREAIGIDQLFLRKNPHAAPDSVTYNRAFRDGMDAAVIAAPATDLAKQWDGWGTALKPSAEFWWLVRKPLSERNVALNVARWGTGALNIDASRVPSAGENPSIARRKGAVNHLSTRPARETEAEGRMASRQSPEAFRADRAGEKQGRFPSHLLLSHTLWCVSTGAKRVKTHWGQPTERDTSEAGYGGGWRKRDGTEIGYADPDGTETVEAFECVEECPIRLLDEQAGERKSGGGSGHRSYGRAMTPDGAGQRPNVEARYRSGTNADTGTASRFFKTFAPDEPALRFRYEPKASRAERNAGLEGMTERPSGLFDDDGFRESGQRRGNHTAASPQANDHPTVKPIALMRYLCRLITPPGGIVMDCFMGSGSTRLAAEAEGFGFVGVELDEHYCEIAASRRATGR